MEVASEQTVRLMYKPTTLSISIEVRAVNYGDLAEEGRWGLGCIWWGVCNGGVKRWNYQCGLDLNWVDSRSVQRRRGR
jgi:hypothetical protein